MFWLILVKCLILYQYWWVVGLTDQCALCKSISHRKGKMEVYFFLTNKTGVLMCQQDSSKSHLT